MAGVTFDDVSKIYPDGTRAVSSLDLSIVDGEFMVLVGPSGCGKTTALRMVAGLEDISEGVLRIGDRVVNTLSPKDRDIAMVFQSYALYPHMSVADNIAYGLKIRRMDKAEIASRPATSLSSVVLPQPDGPTSTARLPSGMVRSTPRTASVPSPYTLRTCSRTISATAGESTARSRFRTGQTTSP